MGTINQEQQLARIADALEALNSNVSEMADLLERIDQNLDGCICRYGNNQFLCITGNVSTN